MTTFQIIILILIAFIIYKAFNRLLKKEISIWLFSFWVLFWLLVVLINIFPEIINKAADFVGVGRGVDLVIYIAVVVIFYFGFRFHLRLKELEKKLTKLVRKEAINNVKVNKK